MQSDAESFDRAHEFFNRVAPVDNDAWQAFSEKSLCRRLVKREHFLRQDEACRFLGMITEGYVRHYYLVDGKEVTNDFNFEGMITGGYRSFSTGEPSRFNIVAMEPVNIIIFTRNHLLELYDHFPVWQKVGRLLLEQIFNRKQLREESFLLDSPGRRYEKILSEQPHILQRVPLQYIASYIGITQETLSRIRSAPGPKTKNK